MPVAISSTSITHVGFCWMSLILASKPSIIIIIKSHQDWLKIIYYQQHNTTQHNRAKQRWTCAGGSLSGVSEAALSLLSHRYIALWLSQCFEKKKETHTVDYQQPRRNSRTGELRKDGDEERPVGFEKFTRSWATSEHNNSAALSVQRKNKTLHSGSRGQLATLHLLQTIAIHAASPSFNTAVIGIIIFKLSSLKPPKHAWIFAQNLHSTFSAHTSIKHPQTSAKLLF